MHLHSCFHHISVLMPCCVTEAPRDFLGFRDKPNGVVLLDECNVRLRDDKVLPTRIRHQFSCVEAHPTPSSARNCLTCALLSASFAR